MAQVDLSVNVLVDGVIVEANRKFGKIEPGATGTLRRRDPRDAGPPLIEARFPTPGSAWTTCAGSLSTPGGNCRCCSSTVPRATISAPAAPTFLQVAYAPVIDGKNTSILTRVISELELPTTPLAIAQAGGFAAVVLSDVGQLDKTTVANVKKYVEEGGLLMVFPGDRARPTRSTDRWATVAQNPARGLGAKAGTGNESRRSQRTGLRPHGILAHPSLELFRNAAEGTGQ